MFLLFFSKERERYRDPVRECLKALLALGWTIEHTEIEETQNHRGSTRRQSKPQIVCVQNYQTFIPLILSNNFLIIACLILIIRLSSLLPQFHNAIRCICKCFMTIERFSERRKCFQLQSSSCRYDESYAQQRNAKYG